MNVLLVLPVILPLATAIASLFPIGRRIERWLALVGTGALLIVAIVLLQTVEQEGVLVTQIGDWPAPFGITFVADLLSAIMVLLAGILGFVTAIYSLVSVGPRRELFGYYPLLHVLLMGVCGAFLTGDIFNLYVWFEVMLMASFVLLALGGERGQLEGALKYVTLNLLSSALFLAAVGILYGATGTLNMADLAGRLGQLDDTRVSTIIAMLFLVAFGIKSAAFPLFFWLPASYHTPPTAVSAIFAGLLTKVGVYALIRVFTLLFVQNPGLTHHLILVAAGLTMVTGVLGAIAQHEFRRVLSFHIVSQIGYMLMGLGLFTPLALAGSVFYIAHHIIVKANLFFLSGIAQKLCGTVELKNSGGLWRASPWLGVLFLIPALSLAGFPPLSGFFAKLILIRAGIESGQYVIVGVAIGVSLLTLFSMTKIWNEVFWKAAPPHDEARGDELRIDRSLAQLHESERLTMLVLPVVLLGAVTIAIGLNADAVFGLAERAAGQLIDPTLYIRAVMKESP